MPCLSLGFVQPGFQIFSVIFITITLIHLSQRLLYSTLCQTLSEWLSVREIKGVFYFPLVAGQWKSNP